MLRGVPAPLYRAARLGEAGDVFDLDAARLTLFKAYSGQENGRVSCSSTLVSCGHPRTENRGAKTKQN